MAQTIIRSEEITLAQVEELLKRLIGLRLVEVEILDWTTFFRFDDATVVSTEDYWRIIAGNRLAVGSTDHQHRFGLSTPVDAGEKALRLALGGVVSATIRADTADLTLKFPDGVLVELFNTSSGYEGWQFCLPDRRRVMAMGGGKLASTID